MAGRLGAGRTFRPLNLLDDFNRDGLGIEVDVEGSFSPKMGPEYISGKLPIWAEKHGVIIQYIQPGQPQQNACVECYNRARHWA